MQELSSLNTSEPIDYDNLNIITRPRPPRRRQSGTSLVPFRPYVKCLTSIREPHSFADGKEKWMTMGSKETFFKQQNARCIGSLIDDCDISDVIRWDIQGESTRLPMMCKLWMIVDGAVVERGKPHLVQDAAVQVLTSGRNRRSILSAEQRYNPISISTFDRRRRHSWHDVNEYHSVPYYQYTRTVKSGYQEGIQCDMDNEHVISIQQFLPYVIEETVNENEENQLEEHTAQEIVHNQSIPEDRVHISIMTQTEHQFKDQSTFIDSDFIQLFNLNIQTNENILSSIVNPYIQNCLSDYSWETTTIIRNGIEYINRSISTANDYPQWWLQLSTNIILSNYITNQGEQKIKSLPISSPRQLDQSIQTDIENNLEIQIENSRPPSSTRSSHIQKTSSSVTLNDDNYEIIDQINDGNNSRRILPFNDQPQKIDSDCHLSDYYIESLSNGDYGRVRRITSSSKQSEPDYNTFTLSLQRQSYSTPDPYHIQVTSTNQRIRTKSSESTSTTPLATLLERYERTFRERQRPIAIINDQSFDINDVLKRYRQKIQNPDRTMEFYRDISELSIQKKEENISSSLSLDYLTKNKYRLMSNLTNDEIVESYIPSPRIYITNSFRQRKPRFDYYDLSLIDHNTSSAWIRYNEKRIDQLQQRIDLMLQIDDNDENQFILSNHTVTQRIDDIIMKNPRRKNQLNYYHNRILLPHRYNFRFPYRINQSLPRSPRLLTRNLIRSTRKSVRISTDDDQIRHRTPSKPISRPIVSILRHNNENVTPRSRRLVEESHVWKDDSDGKVYVLRQFSIPRYYRLYNDVSFREIYNFSRILETYLNRTTPETYSSIVKNFAVTQQLPTIASVA